jgi:CubicO group peptidase (beta-lactamase class C family)
MMYAIYIFVATSLLVGAFPFVQTQAIQHCALLGPDVPASKVPSQTSAFKQAIRSLQDTISEVIKTGNTPYGTLDASATSFSIDIFSIHEATSPFTFHYNAPGLANSTDGLKVVDSDTIYRLGSISKLLTVYTFLIAVGDVSFNEPITKFIPELAAISARRAADHYDNLDTVDWEAVTVGALASQLGGIPREPAGAARSDLLVQGLLPPGITLPIVTPVPEALTDADCMNDYNVPCTRAAFIQNINYEHPGLATFSGPMYSNVAFGLLAIALEDMTETSFSHLFQSELVQSLGLNATYYSNAPLARAIVPHNDTAAGYSADALFGDPAASYYSSINDMRRLGISILNSTSLTPSQTRRWLKPHSFTANDKFAAGAPWEIYKAPYVGKSTWIYSKGGDTGLYSGQFSLLPDYDMGFTVLAAGDDSSNMRNFLTDIVTAIAVPAMEKASKEEAASVYAGTYTNAIANDTIKLVLDDYPGLLISHWVVNGTDIVSSFRATGIELRLNPSGLHSSDNKKQGFRMLQNEVISTNTTFVDGTVVQTCIDWLSISSIPYGGVALDEFAISLNKDSTRAAVVEARGFRGVYTRQ